MGRVGEGDDALIPERALAGAAAWLRTIAHPHRLRMLEVLLTSERSVGDLVEVCGITQPACSVHLRILRESGLVAGDRRGRQVIYRVSEPTLVCLFGCIRDRFDGDTAPARHVTEPTGGRAPSRPRR